jgi:hypothetical protein
MEVLNLLGPFGNDVAILAISKNTNNNILGLYWNGFEIVPKWILRDNKEKVTSIKDVDTVQKLLLGASLVQQDDGSLKLTFSFPILDKDRDLFFAQDESGSFSLIYRHEDSAAHLKDVYVDMKECKALCRSLFKNKEIYETVNVNLGPFKSFM